MDERYRGQGPLLQRPLGPGHAALRKGRASMVHGLYLVTATTVDRQPLFSDLAAAHAAARCFETPALLGDSEMLAWVLMPDHVHWLIGLGPRDGLAVVVGRLKSASAREANRTLSRQGAVWARAFHDRGLRREEDVRAIARYVIANPIRAGLVSRVGDYPFWNAIWL